MWCEIRKQSSEEPCDETSFGKKALSSLSPVERYEAQYMGASEFLTRRVNEEWQGAFEAGVPSSQLFHIGTPSENTTSEGFRSAVS